ncbi:MAG TPA: phytanoyl-CoA dioxygenase family protein [Holophagaceae bacterium]|nr:phytanoyl-CoA dioxygenase family protein [Holophagaceae bacterium]
MDWVDRLEREGWARLPSMLGEAQLSDLEAELQVQGAFSRRPAPLGILASWLSRTALPAAVGGVLGPGSRPVRAFWLDKNPEENWALAWHQDTTLAFAEAKDVEGFSAWVNKAHFFHAQAPADLMARMLSTRIHLDDALEAQGALKVLPGTHRAGRLSDAAIAEAAAAIPAVVLPAVRGETLVMRPLLLHGSDRASDPRRRRILHIEWAGFEPPGSLRWAWF